MLRRVRMFLGSGTVAGHCFATGKLVPRATGKDSAAILFVHAQQPEHLPVLRSQETGNSDIVQPDTIHAHVLHHARVPRRWRPTVAEGNRETIAAPIRLQRDNY